MKFSTAIASAFIAGSALAAPSLVAREDDEPVNASGTLSCTTETKECTLACGVDLQSVCTVVGVFDSAFYGLEVLAGFTVDCTNDGCTVYCPVDGTAICAANEAVATFDSVFARGETIIVQGAGGILSNLGEVAAALGVKLP